MYLSTTVGTTRLDQATNYIQFSSSLNALETAILIYESNFDLLH